MFDDLPLFRSTDPVTSRQAKPLKVNSHRAILLAMYSNKSLGLTDEEAGSLAAEQGHHISGYWKRCADLRSLGLIQHNGYVRSLLSGSQGMVCVITEAGREALR